MLENKVNKISRNLNVPEQTVSMVLYAYLCDCLQEALQDGSSQTIFGIMKLNEKDRPIIELDKTGLISLLDKKDIKVIQKAVCYGPSAQIFMGSTSYG